VDFYPVLHPAFGLVKHPAMIKPPLRWGILGAADIARKNWQAILNSGEGVIAAVASRDADRASRFVADCQAQCPFPQVPVAVAGYEALLARPDVDAVYIPLPTGLRKEWVLRAAAAGKHVVCEKPCAISVADLREMIAACQRNKVQFMDGVMFMHSRRLDAVRLVLDDPERLGRIKRIQSGFSFCAPPEFFAGNIRSHSALEPAGCLGDLGWYCLRVTLWAMREQLPHTVTGRILSQISRGDSPHPVPTEFSGELLFQDGTSAGFYCSFETEMQQWAHVSGTRGSLRVDDFVLPYHGSELAFVTNQSFFRVQGCAFNMEPHERRVCVDEYSNNHESAQETNLFRHFAAQVRSGVLNPDWPAIALKTQQVMEACLASANDQGRPRPVS
jgi:predicted dehydrogenase